MSAGSATSMARAPTLGRLPADFRDPLVWSIALLVLLLHLAVAARYDFFRNELYFVVCGRHPDFGYADQPALVPLIAAATQVFGESLFLLRLPAVLAATALVTLTAAIAILLGGGRAGALLAAIAVAAAPALTAMSSTFGTSTFEPVGWTLIAYLVLRGAIRQEPACIRAAGIATGIVFEAKFGVTIWVVGLGAGLALTRFRSVLWSRPALTGAGLAIAIGAPPVLWQALHGFPFAGIVAYHSAEGRIFTGSLTHFWIGQALGMNILLAPLWIAGLLAPFLLQRLQAGRVVAVAFLITAAGVFAAHGKDYYLFPGYPAVFAAGAAAVAPLQAWLRAIWFGLVAINAAFVAPITLPLLSPPALRHFMLKTGIFPAPDEAAGVGAKITQIFSDEFGWRALAASVGDFYHSLPEEDRRVTGIFTWNYGEAAAIDIFGRSAGLPPAMSGEDQYFVWGPQSSGARNLVLVNVDATAWQKRCTTLQQVATFGVPFAMPYESDRPILLCRGLTQSLPALWPDLKFRRSSATYHQ